MPNATTTHPPSAYEPMYEFKETEDAPRLVEVRNAITALNVRVISLSPSKEFSEQFLALLAKARTSAGAKQWDEAHAALWEATFLLNRAIETRINKPLTWKLALSPLLTFALLLFLQWLMSLLSRLSIVSSVLEIEYIPFLWTGAVGGMTIAYWGLIKHTIALDFDDEFTLWYVFKPLLGAIFGLISILVVKGGLVTLGTGVKLDNNVPLYVIAFLGGFSERFFVQLVDRVLTALFGGGSTTSQDQAKAPKASTASAAPAPSMSAPPSIQSTGAEPEHPGLP